jgi:hypothetical protein
MTYSETPPQRRTAIGMSLGCLLGVIILGVVVGLDGEWPENNGFWHLLLGISAGCSALLAITASAAPAPLSTPQLRPGVGLLILAVIGATAMGVVFGQDEFRTGSEPPEEGAVAVVLGLPMAVVVVVAAFAITFSAGGAAGRRVVLAVLTGDRGDRDLRRFLGRCLGAGGGDF